jgi:hypothetical protein
MAQLAWTRNSRMPEPTECPVQCGNRAAAGAFRVWDGPLSVGECTRTVQSARRAISIASGAG